MGKRFCQSKKKEKKSQLTIQKEGQAIYGEKKKEENEKRNEENDWKHKNHSTRGGIQYKWTGNRLL